MELNKWTFWGLLLVYCFVSFYLYLYTSGGWRAFYLFIIISIFYSIILGTTLITNISISYIKKDLKLKISWLFLAILLIVLISQTILLINSVGDCGDGDGSYRFYERLIGTNGWEYCNTGKKAAPPLNFGILNSIGLYSNFLALTILIIQVYYRAVIIIIKSIPNTINNILNYIFKI